MFRSSPWVAVGGLTFAVCALPLLAQPDGKPPVQPAKPVKLPLTRVVLTNAGVGYFHHEGTIDGTARVELKVNEEDVNDLILTLLANDPAGTTRSVTYDNRAPAEITLKAFSIDLTENPSVGHLLNQVRGEKVEISYDEKGTVTGDILSVEKPKADVVVHDESNGKAAVVPPPKEAVERVNLFADDGLVSVPLAKIRKVKFVKPELQAEFRTALAALAAARGEAKKAVAVTFHGNGQRKVSLGYAADAPLWKPTYRLSVAANGAKLESLAAVENTTDEDWNGVRVKLVSGRPITFKMDLYDPLFVPRPVVEPELYASLRPPMYQGPGSIFGGQFGQQGGALQQNLGIIGGSGFGGGAIGGGAGSANALTIRATGRYYPTPLKFDEWARRQAEKGKPASPADPIAAASAYLGESFEYTIADPVTLPRFKSALLPVLNEAVEAERLSIFNPAVLPGYPLKGLRVKNTSKLFLAQGPVAVYEGETVAGQARLPDVKPGETRLLSYAIDLDLPMTTEGVADVRTPVSMKIAKGQLDKTTRVKTTNRYVAVNKGTEAKTVWVTQAIKPGWKLIAPVKPAETTPDLHRFELKVPAGEKATLDVIEEQDQTEVATLATLTAEQLEKAIAEPSTPPAVKAALGRVKAALGRVKANVTARMDADKGIADEAAALKEVVEEQTRLRANLAAVPKESDAYKRYVKKFDDQETEIEKRRAKTKELEQTKQKLAKELADLLKELKAE